MCIHTTHTHIERDIHTHTPILFFFQSNPRGVRLYTHSRSFARSLADGRHDGGNYPRANLTSAAAQSRAGLPAPRPISRRNGTTRREFGLREWIRTRPSRLCLVGSCLAPTGVEAQIATSNKPEYVRAPCCRLQTEGSLSTIMETNKSQETQSSSAAIQRVMKAGAPLMPIDVVIAGCWRSRAPPRTLVYHVACHNAAVGRTTSGKVSKTGGALTVLTF